MRGSKKFCQRGSKFDNVLFFVGFFSDEGREDLNTNIRWRADDGPTLNAGR